MKLTEKKAIEISIELWTYLAKTGRQKWCWDGWEKYREMDSGCALCEYDAQRTKTTDSICLYCPYFKKFGGCMNSDAPHHHWQLARTLKARREYAKLFLEQLKEL